MWIRYCRRTKTDSFVIGYSETLAALAGRSIYRPKTAGGPNDREMAGSLLKSWSMTAIWIALFALLVVALGSTPRMGIRAAGDPHWGRGRFCASGMAIGDVTDGLTLVSFAGVWLVSGKTEYPPPPLRLDACRLHVVPLASASSDRLNRRLIARRAMAPKVRPISTIATPTTLSAATG